MCPLLDRYKSLLFSFRQVTPEAFATLKPDMRLLAAIEGRGIIVTCRAREGSSAACGGSGTAGGITFVAAAALPSQLRCTLAKS